LTATPAAANSVVASMPAFPSVWLNELQAENLTGPINPTGQRVPWVELANTGSSDLSLAGLHLSDNYTNLTQWAFPSDCVVPANGYLVVWCDGQTNASTAAAPHAGFSLAAGAGRVALSRLAGPDEPQVVDYLSYTNLPANWSYGDYPDAQPFYRRQMFAATPGAVNTNASPPITIFINEWMADNGHTLANPLGGNFDDWFELYNPGTNTVDLGGYYLTDDLLNKTKFLIPDNGHYQVPPGGYLLVWADNNDSLNNTNHVDLHAGFSLSRSGESLGLFADDGTAIDVISFGLQTADVSQGRFPDGAGSIISMPTPTPRVQNVSPHTAPVLSAISDQFVYFGQSVQFTAAAADEQSAYQVLTFSLTDAPAGAAIHPSTGVFRWDAADITATGTNAITVRVTDNGAPPMTDEQTVLVYVRPPLQFNELVPLQDGYVQISFDTLSGRNYRIEFKSNLTDSVWIPLGETVPGDGSPVSVYDDSDGLPHRFFRLLVLP
ncbi:MAG: lamin tail domain-containing protein, partial [Pontiellaceae bacterium]|nr:lamin tail domain-containing protein [Pontiellaceae bacterium]